MASFVDEHDPNYNFKGWRFYFNSYTLRGRFNFVAVTWGTVAGLIILSKLRKKPAIEEAPAAAKKH